MAETINFRVRVSDEGSFKKVEVNAEDLKNAIGAVKAETERLNSSLVNWAQASQAVAIVQQSMGELKDPFSLNMSHSIASLFSLLLLLADILLAERLELPLQGGAGEEGEVPRDSARRGHAARRAGAGTRHAWHVPLQPGHGAQDVPRLQPVHHQALQGLRHRQWKG